MANAVTMREGDIGTLESKRFEVDSDLKITIPYETQPSSIRIRGFETADVAAPGEIEVTVTTGATPKTIITFDDGDVSEGDTLRVA